MPKYSKGLVGQVCVMLWQVKIMDVSCARHTVQPFQKGKQFEFIKKNFFTENKDTQNIFFLNSSKKWAITNDNGAE